MDGTESRVMVGPFLAACMSGGAAHDRGPEAGHEKKKGGQVGVMRSSTLSKGCWCLGWVAW